MEDGSSNGTFTVPYDNREIHSSYYNTPLGFHDSSFQQNAIPGLVPVLDYGNPYYNYLPNVAFAVSRETGNMEPMVQYHVPSQCYTETSFNPNAHSYPPGFQQASGSSNVDTRPQKNNSRHSKNSVDSNKMTEENLSSSAQARDNSKKGNRNKYQKNPHSKASNTNWFSMPRPKPQDEKDSNGQQSGEASFSLRNLQGAITEDELLASYYNKSPPSSEVSLATAGQKSSRFANKEYSKPTHQNIHHAEPCSSSRQDNSKHSQNLLEKFLNCNQHLENGSQHLPSPPRSSNSRQGYRSGSSRHFGGRTWTNRRFHNDSFDDTPPRNSSFVSLGAVASLENSSASELSLLGVSGFSPSACHLQEENQDDGGHCHNKPSGRNKGNQRNRGSSLSKSPRGLHKESERPRWKRENQGKLSPQIRNNGDVERTQRAKQDNRRNNFRPRLEKNSTGATHSSPIRQAYPQIRCADDAPQKDRLTEQLTNGEYECMVCCERIHGQDSVWSCRNCFHIFHLQCARKWATSPAAVVQEKGWRCPACQNVCKSIPRHYYCFCGKRQDPDWNRYGIPHSCGEMCGKKRPAAACTHRCNLQCHPGPCPPCTAVVKRNCECGKTSKHVRCNQEGGILCEQPCMKLLNCQVHVCLEQCHVGDCKSCKEIIKQDCYCGKSTREVPCSKEYKDSVEFSCSGICEKLFLCKFHSCRKLCHSGDCGTCPLLPEVVTHCPCGKTPLLELTPISPRKTCIDPVPLCGKPCMKTLSCGPAENPHTCSSDCHNGPCPPCPKTTSVRCRCRGTIEDFPCTELENLPEQLCQRRCNKKRMCGRHKCLNVCCIETEHPCPLTCNKKLSCGQHVCMETCHRGNCPACWNVSFEELRCYCESSVIYPPIPCGTKPPECSKTCTRPHSCNHNVTHTCHSDDQCPPCAALTEKWCFGHHEKRKAVPCFLEGLSCGRPCNKPLPCRQHKCIQTCHQGPCLAGTGCTQPCQKPRASCGHPCAAACHEGDCPQSVCKALVTISCVCGHRSEKLTCGDISQSYNQMSTSMLASKIQDIQSGESVDISEVMAAAKNRASRLECNEECAVLERNRRLAAALHIQNPDISNRPGNPSYSELLKEEAKKNPQFVTNIYIKLTELVQSAKQSKQKCRSYSFPSMNRDQRRVIHELSEFFGCDAQSYDFEPHRNVVVSAYKERCRIPYVSVMSVVQRDLGQRKGPTPVISSSRKEPAGNTTIISAEKDDTSGNNATGGASRTTAELDYFNFPT